MTGCDNYQSGVGEMWPWCLRCGHHLPTHRCQSCDDEGVVAVDFALESAGAPRIEPCPECQ